MPEFYPSIGDAVGAAMQHNIRLAHGPDQPLQVRHLPSAAADPYPVRGMIARLTEDATPHEVAGIIEEINGALVGALPELTELVAAAADWTRARLTFDDPHHNPAFETWTRLAAAHTLLGDVREQLQVAEDGVTACPVERTDPRHHRMVNVLRSRELLDDVFGTAPAPASSPDPEVDRQRAARASSPQASRGRPSPSGAEEVPARTPSFRYPERPSMAHLVDDYDHDVQILPRGDGLIWAHCRTGLPESAHRVLRSCGFTAPADPGDPASYSLAPHIVGPDRQCAASSAAGLLTDLDYRVAIDPTLVVGYIGTSVDPESRRLSAAHQTSPAAATAGTGNSAPSPAAPPPPAAHPVSRPR